MKKLAIIICTTLIFTSCMKTKDYFTITVESDDITMGTVTGGGVYIDGSTAVLAAFPNAGYSFDHWKGGNNKENPREIKVWQDASYIAVFKKNTSVKVNISYWNSYDHFVSQSYDYAYSDCIFATNSKQLSFVASKYSNAAYPMIRVLYNWDGEITTGVFSGHPMVDIAITQEPSGWGGYFDVVDLENSHVSSGNPSMWYAENSSDMIEIGEGSYGRWLDQSMTIKITSIDLPNKLVSFTAEATIGDLDWCCDVGNSWDDAPTRSLTVTATDIPLTIY